MVVDADGVQRGGEGDRGIPGVEVPVLAAVDGDPLGTRLRDVQAVGSVVPEHRDAPGLADRGARGVGGRLLQRPIGRIEQMHVDGGFFVDAGRWVRNHRTVVAEAGRVDPNRRVRQQCAFLGDALGELGRATVAPDLIPEADVVVESGDAESGPGHLEAPDHRLCSQAALIEHAGDLGAGQSDLDRLA